MLIFFLVSTFLQLWTVRRLCRENRAGVTGVPGALLWHAMSTYS